MSKPQEIPVSSKNYFAWPYEEQTQIKHKVLGAYSKIWITKLGSRSNTLFFDCHGGCGAYIDENNELHYGSSILVKTIADTINANRSFKTGVYYCEIEKKNYDNFLEVVKDNPALKIVHHNDRFENIIKKPTIIKYYQKYPALFLVDPFGYNFSINELSELMKSFGNEIIVNFMFDFINRFISKPELEESFNSFFGTQDWKEARQLNGQEREKYLIDLFKRQLRSITGAKYVFAYRLCYPNKDQTYYYLIHATNHIDGITLMKDAFASINNGHVQYLGKNNDAITLFDLSSIKAADIYKSYLAKYQNKSIKFQEFWCEIVEDTAYTIKDLSEAIRELESQGKVTVTRVSSKRGSYRDSDMINVL